jgi:hypothetical protein
MKPCQENPQTKYTRAATAREQSEAIIMWPALRDLPKPTFIIATPDAAKGTRNMKKRHATDATSVSRGAGMGIILCPLSV